MTYKKIIKKGFNHNGTKIVNVSLSKEKEQDYNLGGCLGLGMAVLESCFNDTDKLKNSLLGRERYERESRINRAFVKDNQKLIHMICDCSEVFAADKITKYILEANPRNIQKAKRPNMAFYRKDV